MVYIFSYAKLNTNFELTKKTIVFYTHCIYRESRASFFVFFLFLFGGNKEITTFAT